MELSGIGIDQMQLTPCHSDEILQDHQFGGLDLLKFYKFANTIRLICIF